MQKRTEWARNISTGAPCTATITVKLKGTDTLATIYSDNGVTPKANPFASATSTGIYSWYAANAKYDETVTPSDGTLTAYTTSDIIAYDPGGL